MHFKSEIVKLIDICKLYGFIVVPDSLLFGMLFMARFEPGIPLCSLLYQLVDLGFNPFNHHDDNHLKIQIRNIIAVCDKELLTNKSLRHYENKKKNK